MGGIVCVHVPVRTRPSVVSLSTNYNHTHKNHKQRTQQYFPVFVRAAEAWYDAPEVTTALLKFLQVRAVLNVCDGGCLC